jgi:hypothetical protein
MRRLDNVRVLEVGRERHIPQVLQRYDPDSLHWFGSGREALLALLRGSDFPLRCVLLPVMVPEGVIYPFQLMNWKIVYYDFDSSGNPDFEQVEKQVGAHTPDIAVLIHLFGVIRDTRRMKSLLHADCLLVEDFAHTTFSPWLSQYESPADLLLFSPPKLLGVTDGCLMVALREGIRFERPISWSPLRSLYLFVRLASLTLGAAAQYAGYFDGLELLARGANWCYNLSYRLLMSYCKEPHTFSQIGKWLFDYTDHRHVAEKRTAQVAAYRQLLDNPLLTQLYSDEFGQMPLIGFPIKTDHRQALMAYLAAHGIRGAAYADHWWFVPDEERELYPNAWNLLQTHYVLPVNQKLSLSDIQLVIKRVNEFVA